MDESETYANMRFTGADSQSPSRAEPDVSYVELNVTALSAPRVRRDGAGLSSTYAEVNCPKDEPVIDEDEAPPIAAGSRKQTTNAQTGAHEQEPKQNIENRRYMKICLLCLFTSVLIAIVAGLSIYVSQIRQSKFTVDRNYDELNSTLQSKINEIEAKYKAVNETKAQICELLTSRRGQPCSDEWIPNKDRCYYVSTSETSFHEAMQECSNLDSRLLEIDSKLEANFVKNALRGRRDSYWIGSCEAGKMGSPVVYKMDAGKFQCSECNAGWLSSCKNDRHRFICEKPAPSCADIPEKIRDLCQKPVGPT
ncbi:CD209 antigen-like protein 2 [Mobula birostris]|uniref:CD209 antigen-like protein 2 n=1 Tax=Mobula birostris TaxID=1983395 RepID=UPI003B286EBA